MAQGSKSNGTMTGVRDAVTKNPAADRLLGEVETFVRNRALDVVDAIGDRISDATERLEDFAANGGAVKKAAKSMSEGDSPLKAGAKAIGSSVKDKVGEMLGGGSSNGSGPVKSTLIEEGIDVGVPVSVAYNQWTQFQEFGRFTKGVQSVNQEDETTTNWKAKIAFSTRSWNAKITEQVPDERIAWTADGDKGSVDGVVTFHELAPNLTRVLLELEYHPKGLFEKTGNLWRAQGRRARLDLKNFRAFVMMRGEETGAWRGEIRDGDVAKSPEESGSGDDRRGRRRPDDGKSRGRDRGRTKQRDRQPSDRTRRGNDPSAANSSREPENRGSRRSERDRSRSRSRSHRPSRSHSPEAAADDQGTDAGPDTSKDGAKTSSSSGGRRGRRRSPKKSSPVAAKKASPAKKSPAPTKSTSPAKSSGSTNGSSSSAGAGGSSSKSTPARKKTTSPRKKASTTAKKTGPARKSTARKSPARKSTTRKSTARKSTPRKSTARKSTARKSTPRKTSRARKSTSSK